MLLEDKFVLFGDLSVSESFRVGHPNLREITPCTYVLSVARTVART